MDGALLEVHARKLVRDAVAHQILHSESILDGGRLEHGLVLGGNEGGFGIVHLEAVVERETLEADGTGGRANGGGADAVLWHGWA